MPSINYWLLAAVIVSALLQVAVIYTPLSKVFSTVALGIEHLAIIAIAAICFMIAGIFIELISRKVAERA
ncbi:MAG: cation transporting ATPase C-terminal domain-containing protein [Nanoarchaeota archaeon]|nr:cation transporting ATPase C-terminal domain-containing protein [Nanoarchaeota archaeon]